MEFWLSFLPIVIYVLLIILLIVAIIFGVRLINVLNKVDSISKEELNKVKAVIKALQPVAKIIETNYAKVNVGEIIDTNNFDFEKAATSAA